jgi:hypothetical protein
VRTIKEEENGMPRRKTHEDISIFFLGKPFSSVNKTLDLPVKVLGRSHRKLLHTIPESFLVGVLLTGDIDGGISGVLHVVVDAVDSGVKKEIKKLIKNRGEKDCQKERKNARRKKNRSS